MYGVGAEADPFAYGVAGQVAPFAEDLNGTVQDSAGPLAGNAVTGVQRAVQSATPHYAQDLQQDPHEDGGANRI